MSGTYAELLRARLRGLTYPCTVFAHGPENPHRTRYRREHGGWFGVRECQTLDEAVAWVAGADYEGHVSDWSFWGATGEVIEA